MEKTHWKKIVSDPNFIGEGDFEPGEEKVATIKSINQSETVTTAEGKSQKAVVHFEENLKPMILNVARSKNIEKVAGSGYFEDWPGVRIQLYIEHGIKAFGDVVSAVRVRPYKPRVKEEAPTECADCHKPIQGFKDRDKVPHLPAEVIKSTTEVYGVPLCLECARKRKAAAEEDPAPVGEGVREHETDG